MHDSLILSFNQKQCCSTGMLGFLPRTDSISWSCSSYRFDQWSHRWLHAPYDNHWKMFSRGTIYSSWPTDESSSMTYTILFFVLILILYGAKLMLKISTKIVLIYQVKPIDANSAVATWDPPKKNPGFAEVYRIIWRKPGDR